MEFNILNITKLLTLRQCHRKFYFAYELSDFHFKHPIRRKAFELSKTQNLKMWQGSLIDYALTDVIIPIYKKNGKPDFKKIADELVTTAKRQFSFSESGYYHMSDISRAEVGDDFQILDVHECGATYTEDELHDIYTNLHRIILELPTYPSPEDGKTLDQYLAASSFLRPNVQYFGYDFEDIKIKPQIDLIRYFRKSIHVIDWKVSDNDTADYSNQLTLEGIATLHNAKKWFLARGWTPLPTLNDVSLYEFNLMNGNIEKHPFSKESTARALDYVYSLRDEQEMLSNNNSWDQLNIEDYETTDKPETCISCKFKPLCKHLIRTNFVYDEDQYYKLVQAKKLA